MLIRYGLLTALMLACIAGMAQQGGSDSSRILPFVRTNEGEIFAGTSLRSFKLNSGHGTDRQHYKLVANTQLYGGIGLYYKWLNLTLVNGIPHTNRDPKAPNVKVFSLSFTNKGKRLALTGGFEDVKGMLLRHAASVKSYQPVPSLNYFGIFGQATWVLHPDRFSYRAATSYTWRQVTSGGSALIRLRPTYSNFHVNKAITDGAPLPEGLRSSQWISALAEGGYGYNYVLPNTRWTAAAMLLVGAGLQKDLNGDGRDWYRNMGWAGVLTAGYNGDRYYAYLNYDVDKDQQRLHTLQLHGTSTNIFLTVGMRFGNWHKKILGVL